MVGDKKDLQSGSGAQRAWSNSVLGDIHMDKDISNITKLRSQPALSWSGTRRPKKYYPLFFKLPQLVQEKESYSAVNVHEVYLGD